MIRRAKHFSSMLSVSFICIFICSACNEAGTPRPRSTSTVGWSSAHLPHIAPAKAVSAGEYAVRQFVPGTRIASDRATVESPWSEYEQRGGTGRIRDTAINYNNRLRHKIILTVAESGGGSTALCQVRVQRLDTSDHRIFYQQDRADDRPGSTPIDEDAGITPRQQEAWTELPRDRELERQVLDMLQSRVAGEKQSAPAKLEETRQGEDLQ